MIHRAHAANECKPITRCSRSFAFVLPTHNRFDVLERTLAALGALTLGGYRGWVVVVDNASQTLPCVPRWLDNGLQVILIEAGENLGTAGRNLGVQAVDASVEWIIMLDDDSHPIEEPGRSFASVLDGLFAQPDDVAAVSGDIVLPEQGTREWGGLPEVFVGCGVAIRRCAFVESGGYDASFGYYVEEYDLAAKFLHAGWRVVFEPGFVVAHHKVSSGRDMNRILMRLVRNNSIVMQRYAPEPVRQVMLDEIRSRYLAIAQKENAMAGYTKAVAELARVLEVQKRQPMEPALWDRFTGLAAAREAIRRAWETEPFPRYAIVAPGKNAWAIEQALEELGLDLAQRHSDAPAPVRPDEARVWVVGTMSPGPMLDAGEKCIDEAAQTGQRVIVPWSVAQTMLDRAEAQALGVDQRRKSGAMGGQRSIGVV